MKRQMCVLALVAVVVAVAGSVALAQRQNTRDDEKNLLPNGRFADNPEDPLEGWTYIFDNKFYMENYKFLAIVRKDADLITFGNSPVLEPAVLGTKFPNDPDRWLRLDGRDKKWTWELGGIQVYSPIIRYDPGKRYKITVRARSLHARLPGVNVTGSNPASRIYPIAYVWHPKAHKSNTPQLTDLREQVRFQPLYFDGRSVTGEMSMLQRDWKTVSVTIPAVDRSAQQEKFRENCIWLALKFLVMDGGEFNTGFLDIAEVKIEEAGPVNEVKIAPGSQTKGADGKFGPTSNSGTRQLTPIGPVPVNKK